MYKLSLRILGLVICINCLKTNAQQIINASLNVSGVGADAFTSNIRKIIEDKNNFLWISTQDALCKFDGINIIKFNKQSNVKRSLLGTDCIAMEYENNDDYLFVLSGNEGLNIINVNTNNVEERITFREIFNNNQFVVYNAMLRLGDWLLILANTNKVIYYNTKNRKVDKVLNVPIPANLHIESLFTYKTYLCAILSDNTLWYFNPKDFSFIKKTVYSQKNKNIFIEKSQVVDNKVWVAAATGLFCINIDNGKQIDIEADMPNFPKGCMGLLTSNIQLCDNRLFFSNAKGIFIYEILQKKGSQLVSNKSEDNENFLKSANAFFYKQNKLWVGGPFGIANINLQSVFSTYYRNSTNGAIRIGQAFSINSISNNKVVVAANDGLYLTDIKLNIIKKLNLDHYVNSIVELFGNGVLLSSTKDMFILKDDRLQKASKLYPELKMLSDDFFCNMEQFGNNKIILVSNNKYAIYLWDMQTHTIQKINKASNTAQNDLQLKKALVQNQQNILLLSSTCLQVTDVSSQIIKTVFDIHTLALGNENTETFMDICKQKDSYWIAAYGFGLIQLDAQFKIKKKLTYKNGINNLGIYKVFNVNDSLIVATTNSGLIVYNCNQNKIKTFYEADGLQSSSFNELCGFQKNDTLYIGGLKGFTIFDAKKYAINSHAPQLYFTNISYDTPTGTFDTTNLFIKSWDIPNNYIQAKISFIGLNYINPQRVQYWYRINGLQDEWAQLNTNNFIPLVGINPGHYIIEVKAANEDGVECKPISMELYFIPKWYQTILFELLVIMTSVFILYGLYRYRINEIKYQQKIRHTIASDLHDDIGSLLNSAKVFNNLAKTQPEQKEYFNHTDESLTEASIGLRDMIWILDNSEDTINELMERIKKFAIPIAKASGIQFNSKISLPEKRQLISKNEKRNLFLILKESINNSIKYAECNNITIDFYEGKKGMILNIIDDGKGFDMEHKPHGNGLQNISERAKQINCTCEIITLPGSGTRIIIAKR